MKHVRPAFAMTLLFAICFGVAFPILLYAIGRLPGLRDKADGSLVVRNGAIVGSTLIGQRFTSPRYFHPRPSAAGSGYDANNSSGTNLGPTSDKLINGVHRRMPDGKEDPGNFDGVVDLVKAYRIENGLAEDAKVPVDAVTRSGSGLDPHITVANAIVQAERVAKARRMRVQVVRKLIDENTDSRFLMVFGEPAVNVLRLNLALDEARN